MLRFLAGRILSLLVTLAVVAVVFALVQFGRWAARAATGDLGNSIFLHQPVTAAIAERLEPTGILTLLATLVSVLLGCRRG